MSKKVLILGGDLRQLKVCDEFIKSGFKTSIYGFSKKFVADKNYNIYENLSDAISENEIIIMGLPISKDGIKCNAPLFSSEILLNDVAKNLNSSHIVVGGIIDKDFKNTLSEKNILIHDYYHREELIVKNVIPTVEGAIAIAMEETPYTIHNSNCLVTGFGRIGKILAKTLEALGANVTVSARKVEDFAWAYCYSHKIINTSSLKDEINKFDIIFNTIPFNIIDKECLKRTKSDAIIIDLASKPGGIDFNYAKLLGVKTIWALSIPGKVAPHTAGMIIKDTITNILTELGV